MCLLCSFCVEYWCYRVFPGLDEAARSVSVHIQKKPRLSARPSIHVASAGLAAGDSKANEENGAASAGQSNEQQIDINDTTNVNDVLFVGKDAQKCDRLRLSRTIKVVINCFKLTGSSPPISVCNLVAGTFASQSAEVQQRAVGDLMRKLAADGKPIVSGIPDSFKQLPCCFLSHLQKR